MSGDEQGFWEYANVNTAGIWGLWEDDSGVVREVGSMRKFRGKIKRRWVGPWEPFDQPDGEVRS